MPKPVTKSALSKLNPNLQKGRKEPLWKGPSGEGPMGGITFSMLTRFLSCRERFRVYAIEGLRTIDKFNARMEYGQLWHACEEALAAKKPWEDSLLTYVKDLSKRYPMDRVQVSHWYNVCKVQFPIYVQYWKKQPDVKERTPVYQEKVFDVPYVLPSGRVIRLRGKFDAVDIIGKGSLQGVYLQENKTKANPDEIEIKRQLLFDLQTMMYLVVLQRLQQNLQFKDARGFPIKAPIKGVRYNVIRRPLAGGRGIIVRHKPTKKKPQGESFEEFYNRLKTEHIAKEPEYYFARWKCEVGTSDIDRFRRECLDPILEQLCAWYEVVTSTSVGKAVAVDPFGVTANGVAMHWRHPFGSENTIDEYGHSDLDEYIQTGSKTGLHSVDTLFRELQ